MDEIRVLRMHFKYYLEQKKLPSNEVCHTFLSKYDGVIKCRTQLRQSEGYHLPQKKVITNHCLHLIFHPVVPLIVHPYSNF